MDQLHAFARDHADQWASIEERTGLSTDLLAPATRVVMPDPADQDRRLEQATKIYVETRDGATSGRHLDHDRRPGDLPGQF